MLLQPYAPPGPARVELDAVGGGNFGTGTSPKAITWTHVIGASATALVVGVAAFSTTSGGLNNWTHACLCGSTSMTLLGGEGGNGNNSSQDVWVELWGLNLVGTGLAGTTPTITVTETFTGNTVFVEGNSVSYTSVASFGTAVINHGSGNATTSGSITSAIGNMVAAAQCSGNSTSGGTLTSPSSGNRYAHPTSLTADYPGLIIQDASGAASVTLTATGNSNSNDWASVGVNLIAG